MKVQSYIIFFLLLGVLPDICLWKTILTNWPVFGKLAVCLPTLGLLVCLLLILCIVRYSDSVRVFSWLTFLFALPKTVLALFSLAGWTATGAILAGAVFLFFLVLIFYVTRHLQVYSEDLSFEDLPDLFDGLRICQLSDFHLGSFGRKSHYIRRIIDTTLSQTPDLILFTGDLVNFESDEALPYRNEMRRLSAPLGVFAIRGNHDYLLHGHHNEEERLSDMDRLLKLEQSFGWRILRNEHVLLERDREALALIGVDNVSANPFFKKESGDLPRALQGLAKGLFKILLSHDPSHWRAEVVPDGSIALTLSGHTHGLKYKMAGRHISHWHLPESAGTYRENRQVLHVSKGLGSAFAFRLGGFPNIDILTLRRAKTHTETKTETL